MAPARPYLGLFPFRLAASITRSYPVARSCLVAFRRILVFIVRCLA